MVESIAVSQELRLQFALLGIFILKVINIKIIGILLHRCWLLLYREWRLLLWHLLYLWELRLGLGLNNWAHGFSPLNFHFSCNIRVVEIDSPVVEKGPMEKWAAEEWAAEVGTASTIGCVRRVWGVGRNTSAANSVRGIRGIRSVRSGGLAKSQATAEAQPQTTPETPAAKKARVVESVAVSQELRLQFALLEIFVLKVINIKIIGILLHGCWLLLYREWRLLLWHLLYLWELRLSLGLNNWAHGFSPLNFHFSCNIRVVEIDSPVVEKGPMEKWAAEKWAAEVGTASTIGCVRRVWGVGRNTSATNSVRGIRGIRSVRSGGLAESQATAEAQPQATAETPAAKKARVVESIAVSQELRLQFTILSIFILKVINIKIIGILLHRCWLLLYREWRLLLWHLQYLWELRLSLGLNNWAHGFSPLNFHFSCNIRVVEIDSPVVEKGPMEKWAAEEWAAEVGTASTIGCVRRVWGVGRNTSAANSVRGIRGIRSVRSGGPAKSQATAEPWAIGSVGRVWGVGSGPSEPHSVWGIWSVRRIWRHGTAKTESSTKSKSAPKSIS